MYPNRYLLSLMKENDETGLNKNNRCCNEMAKNVTNNLHLHRLIRVVAKVVGYDLFANCTNQALTVCMF